MELIFETIDIDWFCIDQHNNIAHFASAGGAIPKSVINNLDLNSKTIDYILQSDAICNYAISSEIKLITNDFEKYIKSFRAYAERGIYSYDKVDMQNHNENVYRLVAKPDVSLKYNGLPTHIAEFISCVRVKGDFKEMSYIDITPYVFI